MPTGARLVRRLLGYVRRYRRHLGGGLLCSSIAAAVTLGAPLVLERAIDDLTIGVTLPKLRLYGSALVGVGVVSGFFRFWTRALLMAASRHIEYEMRNDVFARLQRLPAAYFQTHRIGDLMSRATNDLTAVRAMIGFSIMHTANTLFTLMAVLAMMLAIDAKLTLLALIPLPFVWLSVVCFGGAIHRGFDALQQQLSDVSAVAQETLSSVRAVRAYRQEAATVDRFWRANDEYFRRSRRLIVLQAAFVPTMSLLLGLGAMIVLWFGSREVIGNRITVGQLVAFSACVALLSWPVIALGWVVNMVQRGMASWKRIVDVLDVEPAGDALERRNTDVGRELRGDIELRNLAFAYAGTPILHDVSARIPAGQTTAIVGVTGAGKSTLVNLLVRVYEPPRGTVFIDGVDVRDWPLDALRGAVGVVSQDPFLFSDTIADNVAFGLDAAVAQPSALTEHARRQRIEDAAAVARLDMDVADFPQGYDTIVGERGATLSGGQKQRATIARALLVDPRILILDDGLSAVDTGTEDEILGGLHHVMRDRTVIIVSHRIATVCRADQILVLDAGRIVERGAHDALVRRNGLYAELHRRQLLEDELAAS